MAKFEICLQTQFSSIASRRIFCQRSFADPHSVSPAQGHVTSAIAEDGQLLVPVHCNSPNPSTNFEGPLFCILTPATRAHQNGGQAKGASNSRRERHCSCKKATTERWRKQLSTRCHNYSTTAKRRTRCSDSGRETDLSSTCADNGIIRTCW